MAKVGRWEFLCLAAAISLVAWWRTPTHWTSLYDPAFGDLAVCQESLDGAGIPSRLSAWNDGIEVDRSDLARARATLAAKRLPRIELSRDCTGEPAQHKRALLQESLRCVPGPEDAFLKVVLPEERAFGGESAPTKSRPHSLHPRGLQADRIQPRPFPLGRLVTSPGYLLPRPSGIMAPMEIQRRPIPGSYIVAADSRRARALSQEVRVEKVLGRSQDTTFLLVQADAARADFMPNYEYTGDLFDKALPGNSAQPIHLDIIEAPRAWEVTRGNPTVAGAITDSGPDLAHSQLKDTLWQNPGEIDGNGVDDDGNGKVDDKSGWDFSDNDKNPSDPEGMHHTHVHGIVCAQPGNGVSGVAPGSKAMDLRIAGGKRPFSSSILVESYLYALKAGVKSINTSFNIDAFVGDKAIASTYRELADQNVLLFNSAGNDSKRNPKRSQFDDLILVASTDTAEATRDQRSEFSNYGVGIDISAPGGDILSTLPGGRVGALSGTSMASPVAMGVDLLVQSAHPDWSAAQRWAQIAGTADRLEGDEMGYGRVNAGRALTETLKAPTMSVTTETFPNGQCMELTVRFDKVLDPASAKDPRAFQVLNEQGAAVIQGAPKEVRLGTNQLTFNFAKLPKGHYKFVASGQLLRDPFGQPLDGNKDGQTGDDLVVEFERVV